MFLDQASNIAENLVSILFTLVMRANIGTVDTEARYRDMLTDMTGEKNIVAIWQTISHLELLAKNTQRDSYLCKCTCNLERHISH